MKMVLAEKYRPLRFEDVKGQEEPVRALQNSVRLGQGGQHFLLHGTHGSGKTSLALIYGKALNCPNLRLDMSPCYTCPSCADEKIEYDVARHGGDQTAVMSWVDNAMRRSITGRKRLIFLDEVQSLQAGASDALLKLLERPPEDIYFMFATTERHKLRHSLRSRLVDLTFRSLSVARATELLRDTATKEGFTFEPAALALLTSIKRGYPRDLITGLEQVVDNKHVSVDRVRSVFDVSDVDHLAAYFLALADGDVAGQCTVMSEWRLSDLEKIDWIRSYLTSVYYQCILRQDISINPLIEMEGRGNDVVRRLVARLSASEQEMADAWHLMTQYWSGPVHDAKAARLRLSLFEDLVNRRFLDGFSAVVNRPTATLTATIDAGAARVAALLIPTQTTGFMTRDDVGLIINRASFLGQHCGVLFNSAFTVFPSLDACKSEMAAMAAIDQFASDLREWAGQRDFACITVLERNESGVYGRLVAHIPGVAVDPDLTVNLRRFCDGSTDQLGRQHVTLSTAAAPLSWAFHWKEALDLCAAYLQPVDGMSSPDLLSLLGITRRRETGPVQRVVALSGAIDDHSFADACSLKMAPLSAFDAQRWDWVTGKWELEEHKERRRNIRRRRAQIEQIYPGAQASDERKVLFESWPEQPELRLRRKFKGWW